MPRRKQPARTAMSARGLKAQLAEILRENRSLGDQQVTAEQQLGNLATQYVALNSLHRALKTPDVVAAIQEIVANLIGCEEMAIFETDEARGRLTLLASLGINAAAYQNLRIGEGPIGTVALTGELMLRNDGEAAQAKTKQTPLACIPLRLDGRVAGVLVIFTLLPQKSGLEDVDLDLFEVLAAHAASALLFARLYSETGSESGVHA